MNDYTFRFFILQMSKISIAFVCRSDLLLPDPTILLAAKLSVCQNSELLFRNCGSENKERYIASSSCLVELLHFSVLAKSV